MLKETFNFFRNYSTESTGGTAVSLLEHEVPSHTSLFFYTPPQAEREVSE
jgi:hypothetical protein